MIYNDMRRIVLRFAASEKGSVLITMALMFVMLLISVGAAIDMARVQTARAKLASCADTAGLAGLARVGLIAGDPTEAVKQNVNAYFTANCTNGLDVSAPPTIVARLSADWNTLTLDITAYQNTKLMSIVGIKSLQFSAHSVVSRANDNGIELALVLDNTGSMNDPVDPTMSGSVSKIAALKTSATSLINILYGNNNTAPSNLWIGIVPFAQAVNIGTQNKGWLDSDAAKLDFGPSHARLPCDHFDGQASSTTPPVDKECDYTLVNTKDKTPNVPNFGLTHWSGCVEARDFSKQQDINDDPPSLAPFPVYWYKATFNAYKSLDNEWVVSQIMPPLSGKLGDPTTTLTKYGWPLLDVVNPPTTPPTYPLGPNAYCTSAITPMTRDKATLLNGINNMFAAGQTLLPIGVAWGGRLLSPRWRGVWGGDMAASNLPNDYHKTGNLKVLVLMTDGYNTFFPGGYTAYGFLDDHKLGTKDETTAENTLNSRTLKICRQLKNQGVIIFTIGFGLKDSGPDKDVDGQLLQQCASDADKYRLARSDADLLAIFEKLAATLLNLRITK